MILRSLPFLACLALAVNGLRLRRRLRRLRTLTPSDRPVAPSHAFLVSVGVVLPEAIRRAASEYALLEGLDVCDLVPSNLTAERALDLARMVDPATYRLNPAARGQGAYHALLADRSLLVEAGIAEGEEVSVTDMVRATRVLKWFAPASTDLVVAPDLAAAKRDDAALRTRVRRVAYAGEKGRMGMHGLRDIALTVAAVVVWPWGLVATAATMFQPMLVFVGGGPIRPRDLASSPLQRLLAGVDAIVSGIRERKREQAAAEPVPAIPQAPPHPPGGLAGRAG